MTEPWPFSTVGEEFDVQLGKMLDSANNVGEPKKYLGNRAVQWGRVNLASAGTVLLTEADKHRYRLRVGDLLVCEGGEIGRAAIWRGEAPEMYFQKALLRLRPRRGYDVRLMQAFLEYWARNSKLLNFATQTSIAHLPRQKLVSMPLPLPPLNVQSQIAEALMDADNLIAKTERLIAKKQAIKQGMMQALLTGNARLPGFTEPWTERTLGEVARVKTGSRNNQDKSAGGRYPFFVRSATVERINSYSYDCEAILVPGEGGIGSIFHYIDGKFEVHQRVYVISDFAAGVCGRFIYHFMSQYFGPHAMENSVKATVDSLRLPTFKNFNIRRPAFDEQRAIVDALDDAATELESIQRRLQKARTIKQGMMQQLLTGRVRLPLERAA
jgi:type I restriction enzyme S subunit